MSYKSFYIQRIIHGIKFLILDIYMNEKNLITSIANTLITQYGDDAETVAMLRAAEYAAEFNNEEWVKWEKVISAIHTINQSPVLDG